MPTSYLGGNVLLAANKDIIGDGVVNQENGIEKSKSLEVESASKKLDKLRIYSYRKFCLYPGSTFKGYQKSTKAQYEVKVVIKDIRLEESFLCGYLTIMGLTDDYPELTTYFETEIIGRKHSFVTGKWEADEDVDRQHWQRFEAFQEIMTHYNQNNIKNLHDVIDDDIIFMRLKEQFLVPDHRVRSINGASFAGFYYMCADIKQGCINGFYYHINSELFQKLTLEHVAEKNSSSYEFR
jgi:hypothetical protein